MGELEQRKDVIQRHVDGGKRVWQVNAGIKRRLDAPLPLGQSVRIHKGVYISTNDANASHLAGEVRVWEVSGLHGGRPRKVCKHGVA